MAEAKTRLDAMPAPKNGQVRAVPDERTARYYATLGLIDRPAAMRGRTAFYNRRHLAQLVAIKRMQTAEHSLADIQAMWPTIDDATLTRISGVLLKSTLVPKPTGSAKAKSGRKDFWKTEIDAKGGKVAAQTHNASELDEHGRDHGAPTFDPYTYPVPPTSMPMLAGPRPTPAPRKPAELRVEIAPGVAVTIALPTERSISISPADLDAIRVAAASVVTELANRGLIARGTGTLEEKP